MLLCGFLLGLQLLSTDDLPGDGLSPRQVILHIVIYKVFPGGGWRALFHSVQRLKEAGTPLEMMF